MKTLMTTTAAAAIALGLAGAAAAQTADMRGLTVTDAVAAGDIQGSDFIGMRVYGLEGELPMGETIDTSAVEWDDLGEVNDIIMTPDGRIDAVLLGIGGFLGLGERDVAMQMSELSFYTGEDGERFLAVSATQEELEALPEYDADTYAFSDQSVDMDGMALTGTDADVTMETGEIEAEPVDMVESDTSLEARDEIDMATADIESDEDTLVEGAADGQMAETEMTEDGAELEMADTDAAVPSVDPDPLDMNDDAMVADAETDMDADADVVMAEGDMDAEPVEGDTTETVVAEGGEQEFDTNVVVNQEEAVVAEVEDGPIVGENDAVMEDGMVADANPAMDGERRMLSAPIIEREGYATADATELTAEELTGTRIYGINDEFVGEIGDLIVAEDGSITEVIIDVGGFLGLGEKPVAVTFDELQMLSNDAGTDLRIYIDSTEEALESLPRFEG
ncbi:MAG: PRC-barrel domain-containing protein [Paracoccaceae bacterium]